MVNHKFLLSVLLTSACIAASPVSAKTIKTLILGDNGSIESDSAILLDLTGTDSRLDHSGSSAYDLGAGLPSMSFLSDYDSVLVFTNYGSVNTTDLSNLLGNYVNQGGGVVISTFWGQTAGTAGGLLNSTGYNPLINPTGDAYENQTLGTYDATDPLMQNVATLSSSEYNGDYEVGLDVGATLAASWASGKPLAAYNASHSVAAVTLFPDVLTYGHASGDYRPLFANALAFTGGADVAAVPEPATWSLMISGFGMIGFGMRRRRVALTG